MERFSDLERPKRRSTRLSRYTYSEPGAYFVTVCTQDRRCILSRIVGEGLAPPAVKLTAYGRIADKQIRLIETRYPSIRVDHYVIMPNHIHLLCSISGRTGGASPSPTIMDAVRVFKSGTTRLCGCGGKLFQRSFHDHIVRSEADYREIWTYIDTNPLKWREDRFYAEQTEREPCL